jgi:hypothetical protein
MLIRAPRLMPFIGYSTYNWNILPERYISRWRFIRKFNSIVFKKKLLIKFDCKSIEECAFW